MYASHYSYSLLVCPRGDVRVVSLMANGFADIYKDNTRKRLRTKHYVKVCIFIYLHFAIAFEETISDEMSNRRSIITTGLKLFRISMLSTEPAPSTVAVKPKITVFKTPSNNGNCYYWYCIMHWLTWQFYLAIHSVSSKYMGRVYEALWVRRLVWLFSGSICHFVGFTVHWLINSCGNSAQLESFVARELILADR